MQDTGSPVSFASSISRAVLVRGSRYAVGHAGAVSIGRKVGNRARLFKLQRQIPERCEALKRNSNFKQG